jgi:hypothetical protein
MERLKRSLDQDINNLRTQVSAAIETAKEVSRNDCRQLGERLSGVGQLMQSERNMREVALEKVTKSIGGIHDRIDAERSQHQQNTGVALTHIEGARKQIEAERCNREALEDKHTREVQAISQRVTEVHDTLRQSMEEYSRMFERSSQESADHNELHRQRVQKHRGDIDASMEASAARMKVMEERSEILESRLTEQQQRHNEALERLAARHEKVAGHVENVKFQHSQHLSNVDILAKKMQELEFTVTDHTQNLRESTSLERMHRQQEIQSVRDAIKSDQERLNSTIEHKIQKHVGNESNNRQEMGQNIMEMVQTAMKDKPSESVQVVRKSSAYGGSMSIPTSSVAIPALPLALHSTSTSVNLTNRGSYSPTRSPVQRAMTMPLQGIPTGSSSAVPAGSSCSIPPTVPQIVALPGGGSAQIVAGRTPSMVIQQRPAAQSFSMQSPTTRR